MKTFILTLLLIIGFSLNSNSQFINRTHNEIANQLKRLSIDYETKFENGHKTMRFVMLSSVYIALFNNKNVCELIIIIPIDDEGLNSLIRYFDIEHSKMSPSEWIVKRNPPELIKLTVVNDFWCFVWKEL